MEEEESCPQLSAVICSGVAPGKSRDAVVRSCPQLSAVVRSCPQLSALGVWGRSPRGLEGWIVWPKWRLASRLGSCEMLCRRLPQRQCKNKCVEATRPFNHLSGDLQENPGIVKMANVPRKSLEMRTLVGDVSGGR